MEPARPTGGSTMVAGDVSTVAGRTVPRTSAFPVGGTAVTVALLGALVAASLVLRTRALDAAFWIDEALSVGIASQPLTELPALLRQDGAPPLYYLLLHGWIGLFGTGETATHVLSLLFSLLAVPAGFWAAATTFGRRAGWVAALLAAVIPFLTVYGQETRMYSLVALLSILAAGAFLHAFVLGRRRSLAVFGALMVLLLYTHYWALFFAFGAAAALAYLHRASVIGRREVRDALLVAGAVALVFAPWLPTFVYQVLNTGAPWSKTPSLVTLVVAPVVLVASDSAAMALLLAGGAGLAVLFRRAGSPERTAALATGVLATATLVSAWLASQVEPAWAGRYLAVVLGPLLLLAAAGLDRAGRLGIVALALVVVIWLPHSSQTEKSNVKEVAEQIAPTLKRGDVVVSTQPDQVPALHYYLPDGLAYATPVGYVADPRVMDWRDALARLEAARPERSLHPMLDRLPIGRRVVLVRPIVRDPEEDVAPWLAAVRQRSVEWGRTLGADKRFQRVDAVPRSLAARVASIEVRAVVYVKTAADAEGSRG